MSRDYEDLIHLRGICQLNLRGRQVGAYLLSKRNPRSPSVRLYVSRGSSDGGRI